MYLKDTKKDNNSSIDRKLSALRGFYKYLANNGVVKTVYSSNFWEILKNKIISDGDLKVVWIFTIFS